jgi:hypothetical protein
MANWLSCTITPGQFSSEYAVSGQHSDGTGFSLFVPHEYVECDPAPTAQQPVQGWLRVEVWDQKGNLVVVRLPRSTLENGQFVTVTTSQLRAGAPSAKVAGSS